MLGMVMLAALAVLDVMRTPMLGDVRLKGYLGKKMDRFITQRLTDSFQRKEIFDEARQAFLRRDDDEQKVAGLWRGEFWGKQMLSLARVADYLRDEELLGFVRAECHRLMEYQDVDGYLGSYADKTFVNIRDVAACKAKFNWLPNWNLWNRKYCIWGMFMAYKVTGDRSILSSVERQMNQWIDMMHELGIPLCESGTGGMYGMPSMSVLKPLLMLYTETGNRKYLDYATEMLPAWNRADDLPPNFKSPGLKVACNCYRSISDPCADFWVLRDGLLAGCVSMTYPTLTCPTTRDSFQLVVACGCVCRRRQVNPTFHVRPDGELFSRRNAA